MSMTSFLDLKDWAYNRAVMLRTYGRTFEDALDEILNGLPETERLTAAGREWIQGAVEIAYDMEVS